MHNLTHYFLFSLFGYLGAIAFTSRFLVQWIQSERKKTSHVTKTFWQLSLIGNSLTVVHYLIQTQYNLFLIQIINAVIAKRQLHLLTHSKPTHAKRLIQYLIISVLLMTGFFAAYAYITYGSLSWIRLPILPWESAVDVQASSSWHFFGFLGGCLFASRFWIQCWQSEKEKKSYLSPLFWWLSLIGALTLIVYGIYTKDFVTLIGPIFGIIPYFRNLMLLNRGKSLKT